MRICEFRITVCAMNEASAAAQRKEWGAALRRRREERNLTQAAVAELTGIDQASVSRVEAGAGSLDSAIRLAATLGVTLEVSA